MMHAMSEKEIEESNRKIEEWWTSLDRNLKLFLYQAFQPKFKQMYCIHEFKTTDKLDFEYCNKCNLHKDK